MALPVTAAEVTELRQAYQQIKAAIESIPQRNAQQEAYISALQEATEEQSAEANQLEERLMDYRNSMAEALEAQCAPPANHIGGKRRKSHRTQRNRRHRRRTHRRHH